MSDVLRHFASIEQALTCEQSMLRAVASGRHLHRLLLWTTERALVLPSGTGALPGFGLARDAALAWGWPVHIRSTGGSATPQGPGVLNLSMALRLPCAPPPSIAGCYGLICAPIVGALAALGVEAKLGPVPGSFCDGAYNVTVEGRKVAGTAQRWHRGSSVNGQPAPVTVLAHALILFDADIAKGVEAVREFEHALGRQSCVDPAVHCTVVEACARTGHRTSLLRFAADIAARAAAQLGTAAVRHGDSFLAPDIPASPSEPRATPAYGAPPFGPRQGPHPPTNDRRQAWTETVEMY
jgi:lipoate-protein ligase A